MSLRGKIAIVTGSSGGIGRAISLKLAGAGAVVICGDIQEKVPGDIVSTHETISQSGGTAEFVLLDVTKAEQVESAVKHAAQKFGRLDIMINNAGVCLEASSPKPIWDFSQEIWTRDIAINSTGVFLGCKYASAQMIKQDPLPCGDRGWILNLASVFGLQGSPGVTGYVSSKHAVMGITKAAAMDCAPYRIHVNVLCPGYTDTPFIKDLSPEKRVVVQQMHPFRGLGMPEDIANAALFLVSEENSWIHGVGLPVDGGYTVM
ncbi:NAD(P)-binding protein [Aspergillus caelatus]|uniref:NAD(P)-binding protein n=1 Tax=Aspergillus caelatus TaxID=61420 RepID=A0A5N7AJ89_9EURO|nr:NAD(P)-binding protein [Aspergillus caelatus]KAE8369733.1 NAD(P)-binding protein [Aspergillus caelatus]